MTKTRICISVPTAALILIACALAATPASAQTFTTLASFDESTTGVNPYLVSLVQGLDGNFYGTASGGGVNIAGGGTVFKITPSGALTAIYSFCSQAGCADGADPIAGLVLATDGNFYGTTNGGGAKPTNRGTVFKITPSGTLTTLYSFCSKTNCADGSFPLAALLQAADGNFYGTTEIGGGNNSGSCGNGSSGCGTVFKITPGGKLTTLYSFCAQASCIDGAEPFSGLIQTADGSLYGTTYEGGTYGNGEVFKIFDGTFEVVHSFDFDGTNIYAGLVQARDGNLYGTASQGGRGNYGAAYKMAPGGAVTLVNLNGADGAYPSAGLVQGTDRNFYGTTEEGGSGRFRDCNQIGCGTIFEFTPKGILQGLHSFCDQGGCPDGAVAGGGLVQGTDGNFYGTTSGGGTNGNGTVFQLSLGLGPFVKTLTTSGKVGATVIILGTNLTGSTNITFHGTAAAFTLVSSSEITATVPTGATSGLVSVTTPAGVLNSNQAFQVKP